MGMEATSLTRTQNRWKTKVNHSRKKNPGWTWCINLPLPLCKEKKRDLSKKQS
jgi:hypothetical protein